MTALLATAGLGAQAPNPPPASPPPPASSGFLGQPTILTPAVGPFRIAAEAARHALQGAGLTPTWVILPHGGRPQSRDPFPSDPTGGRHSAVIACGSAATVATLEHRPNARLFFCLVPAPVRAQILRTDTGSYGVAAEPDIGTVLSSLRRHFPALHSIGLPPTTSAHDYELLLPLTTQLGLDPVWDPDGVHQPNPVRSLLGENPNAIWVTPRMASQHPERARQLLLHATRAEIPVLAPNPRFVIAGAAIGFGMSAAAHGQQLGDLFAKYQKGREIPHLTPPKLILHINRPIAEHCGLNIRNLPTSTVFHGGGP